MDNVLQQKFFRLLLECSQRNVSKSELMEALNEWAVWTIKYFV